MKQEIAELWAKDLIEGGHKQNEGGLRRGDSFCCLGRLCHLHLEAEGGSWKPVGNGDMSYYPKNSDLNSCLVLPPAVGIWAGISSDTGRFNKDRKIVTDRGTADIAAAFKLSNRKEFTLSYLNDSGFSFSQIGHFILLNWKIL